MAQVRKNSSSHSAEMTVSDSGNLEQGEGSHAVRSLGLIKRSAKKTSSDGLIVLPSEPGLVTFESSSSSRPCSSMNSTSDVRSRSAGRVERSLKLARKKELEGEIPRRNSTGAEIVVNNDSIISNLGRLKLTKQDQGMESPTKTDTELSSDSDEDKGGPSDPSEKVQEAPVELKGEFLKAVMDENYGTAKEICHQILLLEPDNKTCSEFHAVIVKKMQQDAADEDNNSSDEDDDSSSNHSSSSSSSGGESNESCEEDKRQGSDNENSEDDDSDDGESSSDENLTPPSSPINLIMGGLPIRPQSR